MAGETDDADSAADRLEAALERLATLAGASRATATGDHTREETGSFAPVDEITARLDGLIDRLRSALGGRPG